MTVDLTDASRPRRVFILDDHTVVRAGVRLLLDDEPDLVVVGESPSIAEFVTQPVEYDVVVADLILPDASGEQVVTAVRSHAPAANVLILSMVDDVNAAALALRAGAVGYLTKDAAALELVDAVRSVAEGRRYLQPALGAQLATAEFADRPVERAARRRTGGAPAPRPRAHQRRSGPSPQREPAHGRVAPGPPVRQARLPDEGGTVPLRGRHRRLESERSRLAAAVSGGGFAVNRHGLLTQFQGPWVAL